mmetsp:Transcript_52676/g.146252  ORF Transcript_52676/g.146252 Transcript_52676/m.146252 type:complete len:352 (+) Transcript_52676:145-1200(+)
MPSLWKKELDEEDARRWAPAVLLGPLPVAIYAIVIVSVGQVVVMSATTECWDPAEGRRDTAPTDTLQILVVAAIAVSYLFLMTFAWTFLGYRIEFSRSFKILGKEYGNPDKKFAIAVPYTQLRWVAIVYIILAILALPIFIISTIIWLAAAAQCSERAPVLVGFGGFMVWVFWILFILGCGIFVNKMFGKSIKAGAGAGIRAAKEKARAKDPVSVAKQEFAKLAKESGGKEIKTSELGYLLESCKLEMDVDEMENAMNKLDPDNEGKITLQSFMTWFKEDKEEREDEEALEYLQKEAEAEAAAAEEYAETDEGKAKAGLAKSKAKREARAAAKEGKGKSDSDDTGGKKKKK